MTRKYKVIKELKAKGWPTADKDYRKAHEKANKDEKKKFGKKAFDYMETPPQNNFTQSPY